MVKIWTINNFSNYAQNLKFLIGAPVVILKKTAMHALRLICGKQHIDLTNFHWDCDKNVCLLIDFKDLTNKNSTHSGCKVRVKIREKCRHSDLHRVPQIPRPSHQLVNHIHPLFCAHRSLISWPQWKPAALGAADQDQVGQGESWLTKLFI